MSNSNEIPWFNHLDLSYIRCSTLVFVVCHLVLVKHPVEYRADIAPSIADCQAEKGCPPLSPPSSPSPSRLSYSSPPPPPQRQQSQRPKTVRSIRSAFLQLTHIKISSRRNQIDMPVTNSLSNLTWYVAFI